MVVNTPALVTVTHTKVVVVAEVFAATTTMAHMVSSIRNALNLIFSVGVEKAQTKR